MFQCAFDFVKYNYYTIPYHTIPFCQVLSCDINRDNWRLSSAHNYVPVNLLKLIVHFNDNY